MPNRRPRKAVSGMTSTLASANSVEIQVIYRRLRVSEFLVRFDLNQPLLRAYRDHKVCVVNSFRSELARKQAMDERTVRLSRKLKQNVSGEFDITFTTGNSGPQIAFVSGSDQAKEFMADLKTAKFDFAFPDETPTRTVRRGILSCSNYSGECMFVLVPVTGLPSASAAMLLSSTEQSEQQGAAK